MGILLVRNVSNFNKLKEEIMPMYDDPGLDTTAINLFQLNYADPAFRKLIQQLLRTFYLERIDQDHLVVIDFVRQKHLVSNQDKIV